MKKLKLGNSDMDISSVGFGTWALGGEKWVMGWGEQDDKDSIAAMHQAIDCGINWIDTSPVYGLGHAEVVIAKGLKEYSGQRPYVFTKCGMVWDEKGKVGNRLTAASIRQECEDSLRRLQIDVLDLYQIHWPKPEIELEEGWTEMARLKEEGKVRWIGLSNFNVDQMSQMQAIAPITSLQPPYSMLRPGIEEQILPFVEKEGIGSLVYSPMLSGMLTGGMTHERASKLPETDWRSRNPEFKEPKLSRNLALVDLLAEIGKRHGKSVPAVSVAWVLRHSAVTGAIVGGRNAHQVEQVAQALDFRLSVEEVKEIADFIATKIQVS